MFLIFDIIELILFLVMILFTVAYLTVLERKTMAYMQRRVGPNSVGKKKIIGPNSNFVYNTYVKFIRSYSMSSNSNSSNINEVLSVDSNKKDNNNVNNNDELAIKKLYENRIYKVIPFNSPVIMTCNNLTNKAERVLFLKTIRNKCGIYLFQYKYDPNIYYIGTAKRLNIRLVEHLRPSNNLDRFHLFANTVG